MERGNTLREDMNECIVRSQVGTPIKEKTRENLLRWFLACPMEAIRVPSGRCDRVVVYGSTRTSNTPRSRIEILVVIGRRFLVSKSAISAIICHFI